MAWHWVDLERYPRREHFRLYRHTPYPYVGVTVEVEVTALAERCKARGESFYLWFLHAAALAANAVPELRQRIRGEGIVEYDACPTSHIELLEDGTYCYCTLEHDLPAAQYLAYARACQEKSRAAGSIEEDGDPERMFFCSTLPWLRYTALLQPASGGADSNPRITWGKYERQSDGRILMPVSLLAHHALVDGVHLARFYGQLETEVAALARALEAR